MYAHALAYNVLICNAHTHELLVSFPPAPILHSPPPPITSLILLIIFSGQAGAVRLGLSKALASYPGVLVDDLINSGLLVSDTRRVERKKPGQMKARRKFAW